MNSLFFYETLVYWLMLGHSLSPWFMGHSASRCLRKDPRPIKEKISHGRINTHFSERWILQFPLEHSPSIVVLKTTEVPQHCKFDLVHRWNPIVELSRAKYHLYQTINTKLIYYRNFLKHCFFYYLKVKNDRFLSDPFLAVSSIRVQ